MFFFRYLFIFQINVLFSAVGVFVKYFLSMQTSSPDEIAQLVAKVLPTIYMAIYDAVIDYAKVNRWLLIPYFVSNSHLNFLLKERSESLLNMLPAIVNISNLTVSILMHFSKLWKNAQVTARNIGEYSDSLYCVLADLTFLTSAKLVNLTRTQTSHCGTNGLGHYWCESSFLKVGHYIVISESVVKGIELQLIYNTFRQLLM